jgi:transposase
MDYCAGIDVSLEASSVCVVDASGKIIREAKVLSEPENLIGFFRDLGLEMTRWAGGGAFVAMALCGNEE